MSAGFELGRGEHGPSSHVLRADSSHAERRRGGPPLPGGRRAGDPSEHQGSTRERTPRRSADTSPSTHDVMLRRRRRTLVGVAAVLTVALAWGVTSLVTSLGSNSTDAVQSSASRQKPPHADAAAAVGAVAASTAPRSPSASPTPDPRCPRAATACVDLVAHKAWLQRAGKFTYGPVPMNPGAKRSPTPRGTFRVSWKDANHVSNEFNEPMPHAVFFAPGGIAFHQGSLKTSSHGCVHLTAGTATAFFNRLHVGAEVVVF